MKAINRIAFYRGAWIAATAGWVVTAYGFVWFICWLPMAQDKGIVPSWTCLPLAVTGLVPVVICIVAAVLFSDACQDAERETKQ